MRVYNTLTCRKETFRTLTPNVVKMFVCGPTVYDFSHLGHARTYTFFDIVARYLTAKGFDVHYIINITDVDERIVQRAKEQHRDPLLLAAESEESYLEDMRALGINTVQMYARASAHIPEIVAQLSVLLSKGFAYQTDMAIFFDTARFPGFGKLSRQTPNDLRMRPLEPDPKKRSPQDFALWKRQVNDPPSWNTPWGNGRPGWHIEDTAISMKYLGDQYDLHGGAYELIFPHHEAEIAQAEALTAKRPFVRYWLHAGLLMVEGEKMSKSLQNCIMIRDALKRYSPDVLRLAFATVHYRKSFELRREMLDRAKRHRDKISETADTLSKAANGGAKNSPKHPRTGSDFRRRFDAAMDDDFNLPVALRYFLAFASQIKRLSRKHQLSEDDLLSLKTEFNYACLILGVLGY